ncbi:MAG: hypothetical protein ACRDD1_17355, partial [Planctomycetia bacterium]
YGAVKIVEKTDDHLTLERVNRSPGFVRAELIFVDAGRGRTRVDWTIEVPDLRRLMYLGRGLQLVGLLALVVGGWLMFHYVASSPNPRIRFQTVQMLQAVHVLWPPFLIAVLIRRQRTGPGAALDALLHNLPYRDD